MSKRVNNINRNTVDNIIRIDSEISNTIISKITQMEGSMITVDGSGAISGSDFVFDGSELNAIIGSSMPTGEPSAGGVQYTEGSSVLEWVGTTFNINSLVDHLTLIYRNIVIGTTIDGVKITPPAST